MLTNLKEEQSCRGDSVHYGMLLQSPQLTHSALTYIAVCAWVHRQVCQNVPSPPPSIHEFNSGAKGLNTYRYIIPLREWIWSDETKQLTIIMLTCPQNLLQWCSIPFDNDYADMPTEPVTVMQYTFWQWLCWHAHRTCYSDAVYLLTMIMLTCP
jgi:hypothetical protein